jgi:hypothetical protein
MLSISIVLSNPECALYLLGSGKRTGRYVVVCSTVECVMYSTNSTTPAFG